MSPRRCAPLDRTAPSRGVDREEDSCLSPVYVPGPASVSVTATLIAAVVAVATMMAAPSLTVSRTAAAVSLVVSVAVTITCIVTAAGALVASSAAAGSPAALIRSPLPLPAPFPPFDALPPSSLPPAGPPEALLPPFEAPLGPLPAPEFEPPPPSCPTPDEPVDPSADEALPRPLEVDPAAVPSPAAGSEMPEVILFSERVPLPGAALAPLAADVVPASRPARPRVTLLVPNPPPGLERERPPLLCAAGCPPTKLADPLPSSAVAPLTARPDPRPLAFNAASG